MARRGKAFTAFVIGGVLLVTIECVLSSFGQAMRGMSAVAISDSGFLDSLIPWLTGLYFSISAIATITVRKDVTLTAVALIAHMILFLTIILSCKGAFSSDGILGGLGMLIICTLIFAPCLAVWYWFLSKPIESEN